MRTSRFLLLALGLIVCNSAVAQIQTTTPAPKDPQAISILTQALAVSGGITNITAITDYTATGTITYHWKPEEQGTVTVRGLALDHIRVDANLLRGVRSWIISDGLTAIKSEDGTLWQYPPSHPIPSSDAVPYQQPLIPASLALPHWALTTTLNGSRFSLSYKGVIQLDGRSLQEIQAQEGPTDSMLEYRTIDLFIDSTTFQIAMIQDSIPKHIVHQIRYSNYTNVRGLSVPLSISEKMEGQSTWDIQLSQINFNTGLQDSTFTVQ
jgi:hypothetical protein